MSYYGGGGQQQGGQGQYGLAPGYGSATQGQYGNVQQVRSHGLLMLGMGMHGTL